MGNDEGFSWEKVFGAQVRSLRTAAEWTQAELADRLSAAGFPMHQTTIAKLESGARPTTISEAAALATIFAVTLDDMLGPVREGQLAQRRIEIGAELSRVEAEIAEHSHMLDMLRERRQVLMHEMDGLVAEADQANLTRSKSLHPSRQGVRRG